MVFGITNNIDKNGFYLSLIGAKQEALGANLANINTPNYVRKDVKFEQYMGNSKPLETDLSVKMGSTSLPGEENKKVNMTEELVSMQRNSLFYSIASRRVSKLAQEIKTVIQLGR